MCNNFKGKAQINCGPTVPFNIVEGNAVEVLPCQLKLAHSFVNNFKVSILRDSGSTLFGVKEKTWFAPKTTHVTGRTFGGKQETYALGWILYNSIMDTKLIDCCKLLC